MLAAELYAIANGFDAGFSVSYTLGDILGRKVELRVFTDSSAVFDAIIPFCSITEKRLIIYIACLCKVYRNDELANLL